MEEVATHAGKITRIAGPVVEATGLTGARVGDVAHVGYQGLVGEVIRIRARGSGAVEGSSSATIQVYEDTTGVVIGEPVVETGMPLAVELGPGLLGSVYDGLQRPLPILAVNDGAFMRRGGSASPLAREIRWPFAARVSLDQIVRPGDVLGAVRESGHIEHFFMAPPQRSWRVTKIAQEPLAVDQVAVVLEPLDGQDGTPVEITLSQHWPVRQPRPVRSRLASREPLVTGTRIVDALFPVAKGGSAIIPGGFGTGKTVIEQSLARWADVDVVVYVGCGERGNEMTDVLQEFPTLEDPRTGAPLMERTVLIANTSNMPVAAREASIYTGITIAEYYRDMGYDVLLLADSTSRWAEALREISGRLEEMPGEEGFPAYLGARLAEFYERSGRAVCLGSGDKTGEFRSGSVTIVGAVSPPGADFSEPMTQNSMRISGAFWALDYELSRSRHFPAINWTRSYSLYDFDEWFAHEVAEEWPELKRDALTLLQREAELLQIVQLVGRDALAATEQAQLAAARILREDFLQQSAYHEVDRYCTLEKSYWMLKAIMTFQRKTMAAVEAGVALERIFALAAVEGLARLKEAPPEQSVARAKTALEQVEAGFRELEAS